MKILKLSGLIFYMGTKYVYNFNRFRCEIKTQLPKGKKMSCA